MTIREKPRQASPKRPREFVYVIFGSSGDYDESRSWPVAVCADAGAAAAEATRLQQVAESLVPRYEAALRKYLDCEDEGMLSVLFERSERVRKRLTGANGDAEFEPTYVPSYSVTAVPLNTSLPTGKAK